MSDKILEAFDVWVASIDKRRDANGWEPLTARDVNMLREGYMEAALAQQPAPVAVPAVVREAVESAFSESPGWRAKIAAAVRALPDVGDPAAPPAAEQPDIVHTLLDERDMHWLRRFQECCEDPDAGGHDLPKSAVRDLEQIGALRNLGFGRREITKFGEHLLAGGEQ